MAYGTASVKARKSRALTLAVRVGLACATLNLTVL
jgi:hypothetical protein